MRALIAAVALVGLCLMLPGPAGAADPVATADGEAPGVRLDVQDLKIANGVATLRFTLVNDSEKALSSVLMTDPSGENYTVDGKSSANLWAKFPAPPDSVQKIGVVVPHFIPLDDVPLSR